MTKPSQHNIPEFIAKSFGDKDGLLSELEGSKINEILGISDSFAYPNARTASNWQKIKSELTQKEQLPIKKGLSIPMFLKWSAAAVIVLTISLGIWKLNTQSKSVEFVYATTKDRKVISLADGSKITLNSFSKIVTNDLNSDSRVVNLIGEAFFEVNHNGSPFKVKTERGDINVTGTKFSVKNRLNLPMQVALAEGQVIFENRSKSLTLKPGEQLTVINENSITKSVASSGAYSWMESKLVFENEALSTIITSLENQYNTKFEYDLALKNERLTLTFDHLSASQAAELLSRTLNSKVSIK